MELIAVILLVLLVLFGEVGLYRRRGLEGLSYYCHFSETERTEGESLQFVETVTNDKTLPVPWLKAELTTSRWLDFPEANSGCHRRKPVCQQLFLRPQPFPCQPRLGDHLRKTRGI